MAHDSVTFFVELESQVWEALRRGDADADRRLLAPDFVGVYTTGTANRDEHAAQLANGPTVVEYSIEEPQLISISDGAIMLVYRARYRRPNQTHDESMFVSSLWCRRGAEWSNVFSQDTPATGPA
jgi:Domain of unknown function (DUF4440)